MIRMILQMNGRKSSGMETMMMVMKMRTIIGKVNEINTEEHTMLYSH